jgi:hydrophobic/amphiphilic exporter-1 (mainly G- bacteria), HAE1 family
MIKLLLQRPLGALTACACLLILGACALGYIPINLYPRTGFPVLTITTNLSQSSPEEVERLITKPMEEAVADIPGIKKINSVSREGESEVTIQFHYNQDVSEKALEVRSRIRRIYPLLPRDSRFPVITRYDPSSSPSIVLAITGKSSQEDAGQWVRHTLKPQLSRINGVATVRVSGAPTPQIIVDCDSARLKAMSMTVNDVYATVKAGHNSLPAGFVTTHGKHLSVITDAKLQTADDIARVPIKNPEKGATLTVGELASVKLGEENAKEITRYNGQPLITVSVYRSTDADLRDLWRSVKSKLDEISGSATAGTVDIKVIINQAEELEKVLSRLSTMVVVTACICGAVLFFFLGTFWSSLVVLSAIPFSLCVALLLMQVLGLTLDLLSLGGLVLGLGILVDSAIVVVESISRKWSEGLEPTAGVIAGTQEIAVPLFLSMVATVIVFAPVVFFSREVRLLFIGFTWMVVVSVTASFVAAMVPVPILFRYLGVRSIKRQRNWIDFSKISLVYSRMLVILEHHRALVLSLAVVFLIVGGFLARGLSYREVLITESLNFKVFMITAPGTATAHTAAQVHEVEKSLMGLPGVKGVLSETDGNQGRFTVTVKRDPDSGKEPVTLEEVKEVVKKHQNAQFHVLPAVQQAHRTKISLNIQGPNPEQLNSLQEPLRARLLQLSGVKDVMVHHSNPAPTLEFVVNQEAIGFRGATATEVANHVRSYLTGPIAAKVFNGETVTHVRVRAQRGPDEGIEAMGRSDLVTERHEMIPFMELVHPTVRMATAELQRENRRPVLRLSLLLGDTDPLSLADNLRNALDERDSLPAGYDYSMGDEIKEILRIRKEMLSAVCMGLLLIYLTLIIATESFLQPLLIMTAIPFGACGAVIVLRFFDIPVSLPVYVGMMILCGLIVNVNVVMTYTINRFRREGMPVEQAVAAGTQRRLRAILMTVVTTLLASLPMLLDRGAGSSMWSPFALTLASGIFTGALFALVLTPVLYNSMERLKQRFARDNYSIITTQ